MTQIIAKTLQRLGMREPAIALTLNHSIRLSLPTSRLWDSHLSFTAITLTLSLTHLVFLCHHVADLGHPTTKCSKRNVGSHFATAALSTWVLKNPPFVRSITCW